MEVRLLYFLIGLYLVLDELLLLLRIALHKEFGSILPDAFLHDLVPTILDGLKWFVPAFNHD